MTVKLTKFFSNITATTPTSMSPVSPAIAGYNPNHHQQQQQQQQNQQQQQLQPQHQHTQNPYIAAVVDVVNMVDDDDDNMSLYSNATSSIMTKRGHSCNNSQRPLLAERKPPQMLAVNNSKNKKMNAFGIINQPQRQQKQKQKQQQQQQQPSKAEKSYISPYVQQQKRDSAKGLHGFNDFDVLSQQYNEQLRSRPHIGYPYGSPPSPTAHSNDFVFDTLTQLQSTSVALQQQHYGGSSCSGGSGGSNGSGHSSSNANCTFYNNATQQQQQQQYHHQQLQEKCIGNDINETNYSYYDGVGVGAGEALSNGHCIFTSGGDDNNVSHYIGKPSRFEDDFCSRRNETFAIPTHDGTHAAVAGAVGAADPDGSCGSASDVGGPFIFGGMPHERFQQYDQQQQQQRDLGKLPPVMANNSSVHSSLLDIGHVPDVAGKYSAFNGQAATMQSSSDTSSSSRDSASNRGAKFLLRKGKSKRNSAKDKRVEQPKLQQSPQEQRKHEETAKEQQTPAIKCVLVGDGAVGKTNLILCYLKNRFNTEHVPTASDIYNADVLVNDSPVHLTICDTAGQDTLDKLRQLCYPDSNVFLLCFSVVKPETFHAVKTKWAPKFSKTKAALILVGTQCDLRNDTQVVNLLQLSGEKPISYADAWDLATTIGAKYIETSSATQDKVKEVFDTAIWEGLAPTTLPPTPTPPLWKKLLCLA